MYVQRFANDSTLHGRIAAIEHEGGGTLKVWIRVEAGALEPYALCADAAKRFLDDYQQDVIDVIGLLVEADPNRLVPLEPPRRVATEVVQ